MVEVMGFEPMALRSRTARASSALHLEIEKSLAYL